MAIWFKSPIAGGCPDCGADPCSGPAGPDCNSCDPPLSVTYNVTVSRHPGGYFGGVFTWVSGCTWSDPYNASMYWGLQEYGGYGWIIKFRWEIGWPGDGKIYGGTAPCNPIGGYGDDYFEPTAWVSAP